MQTVSNTSGLRLPVAFSALLLLLAQFCVRHWYIVRSDQAAALAAVSVMLSMCGLVAMTWPAIKTAPRKRIVIAGLLLLVLVPWGEILHQQPSYSREDWTLQLLNQCSALFLLSLLAGLLNLDSITRMQSRLAGISQSRWCSLILPAIALVTFLLISHVVYRKLTLIPDSLAYLFQSRIFASGRLAAPAPPEPDFFKCTTAELAIFQGKWVSHYLPGYPLLLAVFRMDPWVLSPILGLLTLWIWMKYLLRWRTPFEATLFAILFVVSPIVMVMSSSLMIHTPELFLISACILLSRSLSEKPSLYGLLAQTGLLGFAMLLRGFSILVFLSPILSYSAFVLLKSRGIRSAAVFCAATIAGIIAGLCFLGLYQQQIMGSFWETTYKVSYVVHYGFGPTGTGQVHTVLKALENTSNNLLGLNSWIIGGITGTMFFLVAVCLCCKFEPWDIVLLAGCVLLIAFYIFFFFQDMVSGPRFFYPLVPVILMLISRLPGSLPDAARRMVVPALAVGLLTAPVGIQRYIFHKTNPARYQIASFTDFRRGLASGVIFLMPEVDQGLIAANDPMLKSDVIIARDLGARDEQLLRVFPRPAYYFTRNSEWSHGKDASEYALKTQRPEPRGIEFTLYDIAVAVATANRYETSDLFDICYKDILAAHGAEKGLAYASSVAAAGTKQQDYRRHFRNGMLALIRILLLPKLAYEQSGTEWAAKFDFREYVNEFTVAEREFQQSRDVGPPVIEQLHRINKRIDLNSDGKLSDQELSIFLNQKLLLLETD